jgi:oligopeptide/dipeptide ABC transporter ATP-binding protein
VEREEIALTIEDLRTHFFTYHAIVRAVDGVSLKIAKGKMVGLVGETGCGKSVTGFSIMRQIEKPGRIVGGRIIFEGEDLLKKSEAEMRRIRGGKISMIFQDPMSSLNPVFKIGAQIIETILKHKDVRIQEAKDEALHALEQVQMPDPLGTLNKYPHELSGGMLQRVIIAIAILCEPDIIIADEPTSALDVTIQAQILRLIGDLNKKLRTSILMITHDFGVLAMVCDRIAVMYAGHLVENGATSDILGRPFHPYTRGLIQSIPRITETQERLSTIRGFVPNLATPTPGCIFHPRCDFAKKECLEEKPEWAQVEEQHWVSCFLHS